MSIIKLTQNLQNFKWTNYDNASSNNSQIKGRHGGTLLGGQPPHPSDHSELDDGAGVPQTFYDGHSKVVTGKKEFERPNRGVLADMESRFGPLSTQPNERGPYGVSDVMDGTKQGRGFIPPGGPPLGFTVDMGVSEYAIGDPLNYALTPLSHTIAAVNSGGPHGSVPAQTLNISPVAPNAWAEDFMTTPLANYVSQYSEPVGSATHQVNMITLTGPTSPDDYQTNINVTPKVDNAHGSDFTTLPLSGYPGLYVGSQGDIVQIVPSVVGLGVSDSISATWPDKIFHQLGNLQDPKYYRVYDHHFLPTIENFSHISLLTDLFENESTSVAAEKWKAGSIHIGSQDIAAPVGGRVSLFSNLMPIVPRHSMYRDAQGNYRVPSLFPNQIPGAQGTFNIPADYPSNESGLGYTITNQPAGHNWESNFLPIHGEPIVPGIDTDLYDSMPSLIKPTPVELKWHFSRVETGQIWPYNQFSFGGNFLLETSTGAGLFDTHPFIRRQVGQGYLENPSGVVFADHLATVISRVEEDVLRIGAFVNTPAGQHWLGNQFMLQNFNPRPETQVYNPLSLIGSLAPLIHINRHTVLFLGPNKYGDLWKDSPTDPVWSYGDRDPNSENTVKGWKRWIFGPNDTGFWRSRYTRLTGKFLLGKKMFGSPGMFSGFSKEILDVGARGLQFSSGQTPRTPQQVVFSQKGAYGIGDIAINVDGLMDSYYWQRSKPRPGPASPKPRKWYFGKDYLSLGTHRRYTDSVGGDVSELVIGEWSYMNPGGFDRLDEKYRTWEGYNKYLWTLSGKYAEPITSKDLLMPNDGRPPGLGNFPGGADDLTLALKFAGGTYWENYLGIYVGGDDERPHYSLARVHSEKRGTPWWWTSGGHRPGVGGLAVDYLSLPYYALENINSYSNTRQGRLLMRHQNNILIGMPAGTPRFAINKADSDIIRHSWRFFDSNYEQYKDTYFEGLNPIDDEVITQIQKLGQSFTLTGAGAAYSINNFLGGISDEPNTEMTEDLPGFPPKPFETESDRAVAEKKITKTGGWYDIDGGLTSKIGWSFQPPYTLKGGVPKGAPRTSPDYFTFSYAQKEGSSFNYYGRQAKSNIHWTGFSNMLGEFYSPFSGIIGFSWKFWDPTNKDLKSHIGKSNIKTIQKLELPNLKDNTFTINDKTANKSTLIHKYSTLAYGHIPDSTGYAAKEGNKGQAGGSGTSIHNQLNYEKTLRSPGELNMEEVAELDTEKAKTNPTKREDWLEALSSKDGRRAPAGFGIRDKAKKIVDDIGDPGQNHVPMVKDDILGVIKKGLAGDKYKNDQTDLVNLTPYGSREQGNKGQPAGASDFIKFKFRDVTNNKFIIFRAILSGISDSITPEWTGTRYIGRPDQVYVYQGAERKVSFSFDIYPKTKQELPVLWEKTNYLVGLCYPSYTSNRMIAPFIELTIGDMFVDTPGFLDSLSIDVDDQGTWEIENGLQLPKHITCQCSFTYVGKYVQAQKGKHYELGWLPDRVTKDTSIGKGNINFNNWPDRANKGPGFNKISPLFTELGQ